VYEVLAWNFGKPYSIDHVTVEGAQMQNDHRVKIAGGSSPSISLTLIAGNVQVQGVVKRAGKGVVGAMVVLVPGAVLQHPAVSSEIGRLWWCQSQNSSGRSANRAHRGTPRPGQTCWAALKPPNRTKSIAQRFREAVPSYETMEKIPTFRAPCHR
jgi:hypothetical protein